MEINTIGERCPFQRTLIMSFSVNDNSCNDLQFLAPIISAVPNICSKVNIITYLAWGKVRNILLHWDL